MFKYLKKNEYATFKQQKWDECDEKGYDLIEWKHLLFGDICFPRLKAVAIF